MSLLDIFLEGNVIQSFQSPTSYFPTSFLPPIFFINFNPMDGNSSYLNSIFSIKIRVHISFLQK